MVALPSRLLARLDEAIERSRVPLERACLQAERAAYQARLGQAGAARLAVDELQAQFAQEPRAGLSARLQFAAGLCHFHADLAPSAWQCLQRAHALAAAAGLHGLQALCSAWLAQLSMNRADDEATMAHLGRALAEGGNDAAACSRIALVLAHCFHQAGQADLARPWYRASQRHAVALGDDATVSALLHNQAWCRLTDARSALLFGAQGGDRRQAQLGADSSLHFDAGIGAASLTTLPALLRAHLWVLEDRFAQALAMFEQALPAALAQGQGAWRACWLADMAWCHAKLGQAETARRRAEDASHALADLRLGLDRAQALKQVARATEVLEGAAAAVPWHDRAEAERKAYEQRSRQLVAKLKKLVGESPT